MTTTEDADPPTDGPPFGDRTDDDSDVVGCSARGWCECTHGREHAENCCVDQTTDSQASEHVFGSAEMEATLNDTKPAAMDF